MSDVDVTFKEKYLTCPVQKSTKTFLLSRHVVKNSIAVSKRDNVLSK